MEIESHSSSLDFPVAHEQYKIIETKYLIAELLGDIHWIHPFLGIPNSEHRNLFSTLDGNPDLNKTKHLTQKAQRNWISLWTSYKSPIFPVSHLEIKHGY